ncbi:hypothetical protein EVAR_56242_1 [Eumeta japonica]|uniref:Uncharacterized protein n=1 Tax=Eumeta variegata TaxID=151549 RepID=A0A4C1XJQ5_EUMVA|nr:hypothetical protein EVAR_56242_1 [Eumeta japonica]
MIRAVAEKARVILDSANGGRARPPSAPAAAPAEVELIELQPRPALLSRELALADRKIVGAVAYFHLPLATSLVPFIGCVFEGQTNL